MALGELLRLLLLAAIWGGSYLLMRVAAPAFGPVPLVMLRLSGAALCFVPWLLQARNRPLLRAHALRLVGLGAINSALPFSLLAFASLRLEAGFTSVLGATVPLFATAIDSLWWRHALTREKVLGIALGFCGVLLLAYGHVGFHGGPNALAFGAALLAALCYGIGAHYGRHHFAGQPVMLPAAGSMLVSAVLICPLGLWLWPARQPPLRDWLAVGVLAMVCTASAYLLYYRLIARIGATSATTVTLVIPLFGVLWGALFLHERITVVIITGMLIILLGISFTYGYLKISRYRRQPPYPAP